MTNTILIIKTKNSRLYQITLVWGLYWSRKQSKLLDYFC